MSYMLNDWEAFILQFGTHFVYDITMGGRAVQQIDYSYESVCKLKSLKIDISLAAKASFAGFFLDSSFDWQKYRNEIDYS